MEKRIPYELLKAKAMKGMRKADKASLKDSGVSKNSFKGTPGYKSGVPRDAVTEPGELCRSCGECCSDFIPISDEDIERVREYVQRNGIRPYRESRPKAMVAYKFEGARVSDIQCPLRHPEKGCMVYPVRPLICRTYLCTDEEALAIRDALHNTTGVSNRSMEESIFGDELRKKEG